MIKILTDKNTHLRFRKVLSAYKQKKNFINNERKIISLMREKTLTALKCSDISAYKIQQDLKLNKGNFYAYLRGDTTKVSRDTARQIMHKIC